MRTRTERSSKSGGAVGPNSILPRYLLGLDPPPEEPILDFGCGHMAIHTKILKQRGFDVTPYDLSIKFGNPLYDPKCLNRKYKTIFASNVVNTLESTEELDKTLTEIISMLADEGKVYINWPRCGPHYCKDIDKRVIDIELRKRFGSVVINELGKFKNCTIWVCSNKP